MADTINVQSAMITVMHILWEHEAPVPVQQVCNLYVARHHQSGAYRFVPQLLKAMAKDGLVSELSTWRQKSWIERLRYWLFEYRNPLFLNPRPPDPTARYQPLVSEAEVRARYPGWWSNEKE